MNAVKTGIVGRPIENPALLLAALQGIAISHGAYPAETNYHGRPERLPYKEAPKYAAERIAAAKEKRERKAARKGQQ
jgi:hypothetical protein